MGVFRNVFGESIFNQKYRHEGCETWDKLCSTLVNEVCGNLMPADEVRELIEIMTGMLFLPGGRYLYYAGRKNKYYNNCYLLRSETDTREDWADLSWKAESCLTTGGGIGNDYSRYRPAGSPIHGTGGQASGPIPKMEMINEIGRRVMQGGSRRSAIYASLNWKHTDITKFLYVKDWDRYPVGSTGKTFRDIKMEDFDFPCPLDMTNISVNYDTAWIQEYKHTGQFGDVFRQNVRQALKTAEPGFSFNFYDKENETLRNAPVSADTFVMTDKGYKQIREIAESPVTVWTGKRWASTTFKMTKQMVPTVRVQMTGQRVIEADPEHEFFVERYEGKGKYRKLVEIARVPAGDLEEGDILHVSMPNKRFFASFDERYYTYGFAFGDGHFSGNRADVSICHESKKPCLKHFDEEQIHLVSENDGRGYTRVYLVDEWYRGRSKLICPEVTGLSEMTSFIAGLFDSDGSYDVKQNRVRLSSVNVEFLHGVRRMLEFLGIQANVCKGSDCGFSGNPSFNLCVASDYISEFTEKILTVRPEVIHHSSYRASKIKVVSVSDGPIQDVYCCDVGVEEHSFCAEGVIISNCTEVCSEDDSDVCNLGSVNMSRIETRHQFRRVVELATKFLLCGTLKAKLPYEKVYQVREKNRRLGLGLMGIHEWLIMRGHRYEVVPELHNWMSDYRGVSDETARTFADSLEISRPVAVRAIAPTGTIGILAGTTTGIEPIYAVAYKRRYLKGKTWHYQYVVDSAAEDMIQRYGVDPDAIESAIDLAKDYERRIQFQADVQDYVDMSISSTINLPAWGSDFNNEDTVDRFADTLARYAHRLRGFTCYPDGARGGQPLTSVPYRDVVGRTGVEHVEEYHDVCDIHGKGICGM